MDRIYGVSHDAGIGAGTWMVIVPVYLLTVFIGYTVGDEKGRPGLGFLLSMMWGIFGVIAVACMSDANASQKRRDQDEYDRARADARAATGGA